MSILNNPQINRDKCHGFMDHISHSKRQKVVGAYPRPSP